ncbi:MAG: CotH kinase family protein, partial [Pirellulales bacterium]
MSMVTDLDNLFDPSTGIFVNPYSRGRTWERPTSLELINPDGSPGFQIDAGMRVRGGASRNPANPKHAFRLFFREDYGDPQLDFPLFGEEGGDRFEKVDLRTSQNYSWSYKGDPANTFLRDVFSRDTQGDLGQPYTRSRYYHLYINGQYWGLYQTQERAEADYAATYFGGKSDDYDVVKSSRGVAAATDGNRDAYDRLYEASVQGFADNANYLRVQGMNPDGTRNPDYERILDVDNLIDYMLITYYTADTDGPGSRFTLPSPNNFFSIYNRENPDGFKWFEHDSEHTFGLGRNVNAASGFNMVSPLVTERTDFNEANKQFFNPHWLHEKLMENAEYRLRLADRVQKQFFGDGALSQANVLGRITRRAKQIDTAIIAESARWGDSKREPPFSKEVWEDAVRRMIDFTDGRVETVIKQMQEVGWLTEEDAPFIFASGDASDGRRNVSFDTGNALVYFTVDGSDPRLPGGILDPEAFAYNRIDAYLDGSSNAKYLIPDAMSGTEGWQDPDFNDTDWNGGQAAIGFDTGTPDPTIRIDSGFTVRQVFADRTVATFETADAVLAGQDVLSEIPPVSGVPVINYIDTGEDGNFGDNEAFPGGGGDNFVVQATATLSVDAAGTYTFGFNVDESARLRIDGQDVIVDDTRHKPQDKFGTIFLSAGQHDIELVMFQLFRGAEVELFFARGTYTSFNEAFVLLGLDDGRPFGSLFETDVQGPMQGERA